MEKSKPVQKFRAGQVSCALWENEIRVNGDRQTILKASVSRRYRDRDGTWKTSQRSKPHVPGGITPCSLCQDTCSPGDARGVQSAPHGNS